MRVVREGGKPRWWLYTLKGDKLRTAAWHSLDDPRRPKGFDDGDGESPLVVCELVRNEAAPPAAAPAAGGRSSGSSSSEGHRPAANDPFDPTPAPPPGPAPAAAQSDQDRLQGQWTVMKIREAGKPPIDHGIALATVAFRGDRIEIRSKDDGDAQAERGTFRIEPGASPPAFRIEGMGKSNWMLYDMDGDRLRLAFAQGDNPPQPKSFDLPGPDPRHPVAVWELVRQARVANDGPGGSGSARGRARQPPRDDRAAPPRARAVPGGPPALDNPGPIAGDARRRAARPRPDPGRWTVLAVKEAGGEVADSDMLLSTFTFRGNEVRWVRRNANTDLPRTFVIDPDAEPKAMLVVAVGKPAEQPVWWVYAFERNRLRITMNASGLSPSRPKGFDAADPNHPPLALEMVRTDDPLPINAHRVSTEPAEADPGRTVEPPAQPAGADPGRTVEPPAEATAALAGPVGRGGPLPTPSPAEPQPLPVAEAVRTTQGGGPQNLPPTAEPGVPTGHVAPAPAIPAPESEFQQLQGTWSILAMEEEGREVDPGSDSTVLFAGNALVIVRGEPGPRGDGDRVGQLRPRRPRAAVDQPDTDRRRPRQRATAGHLPDRRRLADALPGAGRPRAADGVRHAARLRLPPLRPPPQEVAAARVRHGVAPGRTAHARNAGHDAGHGRTGQLRPVARNASPRRAGRPARAPAVPRARHDAGLPRRANHPIANGHARPHKTPRPLARRPRRRRAPGLLVGWAPPTIRESKTVGRAHPTKTGPSEILPRLA